jgi:uncharacterized protein YndB with AHSA1/START domain
MDRGTYIELDGRPAVRFERTFSHRVERVWRAVTEPAELGRWFPSEVEIELVEGGEIRFSGDPHAEGTTGTILELDPPRRLGFTWSADELHFELEPVGDDGCRLILINVLEERDTAARNAAGWAVCLGELDKLVVGERPDGPHSPTAEAWRPVYEANVAAGMPHGAWLPSESEEATGRR